MVNHSPFINEERNRADNDTAKRLVKEFNLNVKSQGYHYEGDFYGHPDKYEYPIALFDLYGYIIIESEHELRSKMDGNQRVHKYGGISKMPNHIKYLYEPNSIINYNQQIKDFEEEQKKKKKMQEEGQEKKKPYICNKEDILKIYAQKDRDMESERQKYINS